jgi:hypothetical protein
MYLLDLNAQEIVKFMEIFESKILLRSLSNASVAAIEKLAMIISST